MPWLPLAQEAPWANSSMNSTTSSCGSESSSEPVEPGARRDGSFLDIFFSWHLCLMMPLSLSPLCPSNLWIWSANETHPLYYKACPKQVLYYKTCTKYFAVPLFSAKLAQKTSRYFVLYSIRFAQMTSQYYFLLQSWHKVLPNTTFYCKDLQKWLPSTTLYFVLQSSHKSLVSFPQTNAQWSFDF